MNRPMPQLVLGLLLLIPITNLLGQDMDAQFTRNEPERVKFVSQIKYFGNECGFFDPFNLYFGLVADYYFPQKFSLHVAYNISYLSITKLDAKDLNTDNNVISNADFF